MAKYMDTRSFEHTTPNQQPYGPEDCNSTGNTLEDNYHSAIFPRRVSRQQIDRREDVLRPYKTLCRRRPSLVGLTLIT
jgi:hypothetical protein